MHWRPPSPTLFPYTTLFRSGWAYGPQLYATHTSGRTWAQVGTGGLRVTALETVGDRVFAVWASCTGDGPAYAVNCTRDRKSTRLNSSHPSISYAVFCLKKKT